MDQPFTPPLKRGTFFAASLSVLVSGFLKGAKMKVAKQPDMLVLYKRIVYNSEIFYDIYIYIYMYFDICR